MIFVRRKNNDYVERVDKIDFCFATAIKNLEECMVNYNDYSELEKLEKKWYISNCFEQVLCCECVKFYNKELIEKIHTMVLKLENLSALIRFDSILLDYYFEEYKDSFIKDDMSNVVELAYKEIKPFIELGLYNQLEVKNINDVGPFNYNVSVLNIFGSSNMYMKNIHRLLEYFEMILYDKNININITRNFYDKLTPMQLAYVYSQFNYFEYKDGKFSYGDEDKYIYWYLEKIFDSLRKRSDFDKIEFMITIRKLGYGYEFVGMVAMVVELLSTKENEEVYNILWKVYSTRLEGQCGDYGEEVADILYFSRQIKELRDIDILKRSKMSTIFEYLNSVDNNYNTKKKCNFCF